jgi:hypothetical protein
MVERYLIQDEHYCRSNRGITVSADNENKNIIKAVVYLENGCEFSEGEFDIFISEIVQGYIGEDDWQLIRECVWNTLDISEFDSQKEFAYLFTFIETGEHVDFGWMRYYEISDDAPINCMAQPEPTLDQEVERRR